MVVYNLISFITSEYKKRFPLSLPLPALPPFQYQYGFLDYYLMCYNPFLLLLILIPKLFRILPEGTPSGWLLCPFDMFP